MTNKRTRRALLMSALSLLLCVSMFVGTTFAWFTDSVTSANNIIASGNLDIEVEYWNGSEWVDVAGKSDIITNTLWEPGVTEVAYLKVANVGSLALKYQLGVNIVSETAGVNAAGAPFKLSDYIQFGVVENVDGETAAYANREAAIAAVTGAEKISAGYAKAESLVAGSNPVYLALVVYMPTTVDNIANHNGTDLPKIELGVNVLATQLAYEEDSFDANYDADAPYNVKTVEELVAKLANAKAGDALYMAPGVYEVSSALTIPSGVSIYGAQNGNAAANWAKNPGAEDTVIKYTGAATEAVFQAIQTEEDPADAISNITIDGVMIDCNGVAQNGILIKKTDGEAMEGIKIANCAVVNSPNNGMKIRNTYGAVVENNYVSNVVDCAIAFTNYNGYHYETWATVTAYVRNNVIENVTASSTGAILIENGMGDIVVSGNQISKVTAVRDASSGTDRGAAITFYDIYEGGIITVMDNMIDDVDRGIIVYKYSNGIYYGESWWEGPTTDNDQFLIKNNVISNYEKYGIRVEQLRNKSASAGITCVEINNNAMTAADTAKGLDIVGGSNSGWKVVSNGNTFNGAADAQNGVKEG